MAQAELRHGSPLMCDYKPGAAVAAGDVIVQGNVTVIAHRDIAANVLGAVAARGGVYRCTADGALAAGDKVHWNDVAKKVTKTAAAGARKSFGFVAPGSSAAADGSAVDVIHEPDGSSI